MEERSNTDDHELKITEACRIILKNWWGEISNLYAEFADNREGDALTFRCTATEVQILGGRRNKETMLTKIAIDALNEDQTRNLTNIISRENYSKDIAIEFSNDLVLRPQITMPRMRYAALENALNYEVERLSPIPINELYWDFIRHDSQPAATFYEIELRILRQETIDQIIRFCRRSGLRVAAIKIENDPKQTSWANFPIDRSAFLLRLYRRYAVLGLALLTFVLLIALYFGTIFRDTIQLEILSDAVANAGVRAARVEHLQQQINDANSYLDFAIRQKKSPLFLETLAELTRILPDTTSITELAMEETKIRIQGNSSSASDLIALIDSSEKFKNAQFAAPVIHDPTTKADHFDLSFDLVGKDR